MIYLTSNNLEGKSLRQQQKLNAVAYLLEKYRHVQKRRFLKKLSEQLLCANTYFLTLPAALFASVIEQAFEFLEEKTDDLAIQQIDLPDQSCYLLISTPDVPFIIDSILNLQGSHHKTPFLLLAHPVISVHRQGPEIIHLGSVTQPGEKELFVVIQLEYLNSNDLELLKNEFRIVMTAALQAYRSRTEIVAKMARLKSVRGLSNWHSFIDWLKNDAFHAFIYQRMTTDKETAGGDNAQFTVTSHSGIEFADNVGVGYKQQLNTILCRETAVIVQSVAIRSPIVHSGSLIYIGFREQVKTGQVVEHAFLGLFKETELYGNTCAIPALHEKICHTVDAAKVSRNSHEYYQLDEIFSLFPIVETFFLEHTQFDLLTRSLLRYLYLPDSIKLLFLSSPSPLRISTLLIIPAHLFKQDIGPVLQQKLCQELSSTLETSRKVNQGGRYIGLQLVFIAEKIENYIDVNTLERELNRLVRPWDFKFRLLLERTFGKEQGTRFWHKYYLSFASDYQALMPPRYAIKDLLQIEQLLHSAQPQISLFKPCLNLCNYRLQFYSLKEQFLDEYLPVLENLGLRLIDQVQFTVVVDGRDIFIKSFAIKAAAIQTQSLKQIRSIVLEAIEAILTGKSENDALNRLILVNGMTWKEIDVLRAYRNYFMQLGLQSTVASIHHALIVNPKVTRCLYDYFEVRFRPDAAWEDPSIREEEALFSLRLKILDNFAAVADINDDRILRTFFNLIDATVRSNFHVRRDHENYFFAFKINSLGIIEMPAPRPQNEIYVHAFAMEGIHLRGGKISRGGIRWSDRPDDFRTEILGLMQTQMSKNALIIPKGAKGGFVVKSIRPGENFRDAGKKAYMTLMHGLLDLTDNYVQGQVFRLPGIVAYDDNDPYLVVAADKGTAQFPDLANAVAAEYKFWLRDAFASGGSQGYNHKALGITARGAWESVKRHFREIGTDIQSTAFSAVGIGSMDGDVFGNGMLLSRCTRLLAAFSGLHIFIDPDPDPGSSFQERQRLFDLPGSSWDDYNRDLISVGGGVYRRDDKDIPISVAVRKWLGIRYQVLDGESLIRYLLVAPVELLWLGGIGTYVKASDETHEQAGDRSNDAVRVDAASLQAIVVGEGANLGFTQKARIEYSLSSGRINTDAIDNSAGVDISDHEVNLKILLYNLQKKHRIDDYQRLFTDVTDEVCSSVLNNNYAQSLSLSLDQLRSHNNQEVFLKLAERLESAGLLDRAVESFPDAKQLLARSEALLTRPELAVLMAAGKMQLTQQLFEAHELIDDDFYNHFLHAYFPGQISTEYASDLASHPLARQIKTTLISNTIINQAGSTFLNLSIEVADGMLIDSVASYLTFDQVFQGPALRKAIYALDNKVSTEIQYRLLLQLERILTGFCFWVLQHQQKIRPSQETIDCYRGYLQEYARFFKQPENPVANATYQQQLKQYQQSGIPVELSQQILCLSGLEDFPQIVDITQQVEEGFSKIYLAFNETFNYLGLNAVYEQLQKIPVHDHWERDTVKNLQQSMKTVLAQLIVQMLTSGHDTAADFFEKSQLKQHYDQYQLVYKEINTTQPVNLLPYIALNKQLEGLLA